MNNKDGAIGLVIGFCGLVVGLVGVGYAVGGRKKLGDVADKLNKSIDEISNDMEVDIPQCVIDKAVNKAVEREVERRVQVASKEAVTKVSTDIHKSVADSVNKVYSDIDRSVKAEIKKQIALIDIREARREVIAEAKKTVAEKFESDLDDILENYKDELATVSKIYKSIANAVNESKSNSNDNVIRLSVS